MSYKSFWKQQSFANYVPQLQPVVVLQKWELPDFIG